LRPSIIDSARVRQDLSEGRAGDRFRAHGAIKRELRRIDPRALVLSLALGGLDGVWPRARTPRVSTIIENRGNPLGLTRIVTA
jgi:hypothetical protein